MFDRFPLDSDTFRLNFGVQAVAAHQPIIAETVEYQAEIDLKARLLEHHLEKCWASLPDSIEPQVEAAQFLQTRCDESHPLASIDSNERYQGCNGEAEPPLLKISRYVQEDLVLLRHDIEAGFPVVAGSVCFPSGWSIADKLGQSQRCVHAAVPGFNQHLLSPSLKLFGRLKSGRSVSRHNWGVRALPRLAQYPSDSDEILAASQSVSPDTAADCMFRVEFQTFSRLPETQSILFTIHTHQRALKDLSHSKKQRLASVISTCPESTLRYKGIWPMRESVVAYLNGSKVS